MRALRTLAAFALILLGLSSCSSLAPDVHVNQADKYPVSWNDVREIEKAVATLHVNRPIDDITMEGPDRAKVCFSTRDEHEAICVTVVRKHGGWLPIEKPWKARVLITG